MKNRKIQLKHIIIPVAVIAIVIAAVLIFVLPLGGEEVLDDAPDVQASPPSLVTPRVVASPASLVISAEVPE